MRRTPQPATPLDDFFFDQSYQHALGGDSYAGDVASAPQVALTSMPASKWPFLPIAGMPHLGSGITFAYKDTTVLASPNLGGRAIDIDRHEKLASRAHHPHAGAGFHAQP